MILVERTKEFGLVEIRKIENLTGLENHEIVKVERGDSIKSSIKKARKIHGTTNCYSVKAIKEAQEEFVAKQNKKTNSSGGLCCVCGDYSSHLSERGVCSHCEL